MTYLNKTTVKILAAIAFTALMTSNATAQNQATHHDSAKPVTTLAQLQLKADALNAARANRQDIARLTVEATKRHIVREKVPVQAKSMQTLNKGRIYTSHDYEDDAMQVYKSHASISARYIPNHFQAAIK